jgi:hypothetical protein
MRKLMICLSALAAVGLALPSSPADAKVKRDTRLHISSTGQQGQGRGVFRSEPQAIRRIHRRTYTHD